MRVSEKQLIRRQDSRCSSGVGGTKGFADSETKAVWQNILSKRVSARQFLGYYSKFSQARSEKWEGKVHATSRALFEDPII